MSPMLTPKLPGQIGQDYLNPEANPPTLLIRVYGPSTGSLIARDEELRILHTLSSVYGLGPRIEGTFSNGRVEQFFPSRALTPPELRDHDSSKLIARRMRELHSVDLDVLGFETREEPTVWQRIKEWLPLAKKSLEGLKEMKGWEKWVEEIDVDALGEEIEEYMKWVDKHDGKGQGRIFCRELFGLEHAYRPLNRLVFWQTTILSMAISSSWIRRCHRELLNTIR